MTDRHSGYIVVLDEDIRADDAEAIINAIRMVKGVGEVIPVVSTPEIHIAMSRVYSDVKDKFFAFIKTLKQ